MLTVKLSPTPIKVYEVIHAFDPGGTTGYARIRVRNDTFALTRIREFPNFQWVETIINSMDPEKECIVCEDFFARQYGACLIPVEVIGVIKFLAVKRGIKVFFQKPYIQNRKDGSTPVKGWYPIITKIGSHAESATAHGVHFAVEMVGRKLWPLTADIKKLKSNRAKMLYA